MSVIISNQIICTKCNDSIFSAHRHDFKYCECGAVAVDGGMQYLRRLGADYTDLSIVVKQEVLNQCLKELDWCDDTGRNNLGRVCALFRALRDSGYLDKLSQGVKDEK